MVSSSDCGNRLDIHSKEMAPVGHCMALSARKHIYGEEIQGDFPVAKQLECVEKHLIITFENARKLHVTGDLINALEICADNNLCEVSAWEINENRLLITVSCPDLSEVKELTVRFAQTPYYQVNLYNECGLPAFPFVLQQYHHRSGCVYLPDEEGETRL